MVCRRYLLNLKPDDSVKWCVETEHNQVLLTGSKNANDSLTTYNHSQLYNKCKVHRIVAGDKLIWRAEAAFSGNSAESVEVVLSVNGEEKRRCSLTKAGETQSIMVVRG